MKPEPASERLSLVDRAWLRMDRPSNLMVITALLELDGHITAEEVTAVVHQRLLAERRFSERVVQRHGLAFWAADPLFAPAGHVHSLGLPAPGDDAALAEVLSDIVSTPLDRQHPLWQVHVIDTGADSTALVVRLHHALGDGVALVKLLLSLTDHDQDAAAAHVGPRRERPRDPGARLHHVVDSARALAHDLLLPRDADSALSGTLGVRKQARWSARTPLGRVAAAALAHGVTVTDVLTAAITGAVRRYLDDHGDLCRVDGVRALVPVNLRADDEKGLGNRFGMVYLTLPVGAPTPEERLAEVHARMQRIKASPEAEVGLGVLGLLGLASVAAERVGIELFTSKATTMITSVPGPTRAVRLAGHRVRDLVVWAPASGSLALTFSLLSYAGQVHLGVLSDRQAIDDPGALVAGFEEELHHLLA